MSRFKSRNKVFSTLNRIHRDKSVPDITASFAWGNFYSNIEESDYKIGIIPPEMEGRPGLLAVSVYGNTSFWWVICIANDVLDPLEDLWSGREIIFPLI